jgi:predicted nucleotidyltransferase
MVKEEIRNIIIDYKKALLEKNVPIKSIMLFGSQSNGKANSESDIDLLLIADDNYPHRKASRSAWSVASEIDFRIEPIVVSQSKYDANDTILVDLVRKKGILIN